MSDLTEKATPPPPEPWLRGTLTEEPVIARAVLHALELAKEDAQRWCASLTDADLHARPYGLASVAFHLRHIVRSLDRLLTYAEGNQLSSEQLAVLKSEMNPEGDRASVFTEFESGLESAVERIRALSESDLTQPRGVGRKMLPTTIGGLLVHCADHTQRHSGQLVTTAKVLLGLKEGK